MVLPDFNGFTKLHLFTCHTGKAEGDKPGMLSQELKEALGIPEGATPTWLISMQVSSRIIQLIPSFFF